MFVLIGCGGMQFKRTPGAFKYRALPVGTEVKVVDNVSQLPSPTADIGQLRSVITTRTEPKPDIAKAATRLKKYAARYGCDAVVGTKATTAEKKSIKKTKKMGPDGKYIYEKTEVTTYTHTYLARCVRTAEAPGGLATTAAEAAAPPPKDTKPKESLAASLPSTRKDEDGGAASASKAKQDPDVAAVWLALSPYGNSMLKNWKSALARPPASAYDVLAAFTELMVQVSGPTGIWRKTMPGEWFGCTANPKQEQCTKLAKATEEFKAWDRFQRAMERQSASSARGWIKRNKRRLLGYIDRYVPAAPSLTGIQQTPLYLDKVR